MTKLSEGSDWALLLAPEPPYPMNGGGAIRPASLLHFLAQRFRVHLVTFAVGQRAPAIACPPETVERLDWIQLRHHGRNLAARAARNTGRLARGVLPLTDRFCNAAARQQVERAVSGRRYALAVLEHFWCAPYLELLRPLADAIAMDMVDVESTLHRRCARTDPWPASWGHRAFAALSGRAERRCLPRFDVVLATSDADRRALLAKAPGASVVIYPNAVPSSPAGAGIDEEHCIAFSGNLEYHPNVSAVRFFGQEVWPRLREQDARLRWRLIGRNEHAVRSLVASDPRIELTGAVEDPLRELARAKVVVAPVLAGSGTRVKILEAWAASRAVVSTRVGAEGLPASNGENLLLADSPREMAEAVLSLLEDMELRRRIGRAGRRTVEQQLCWPVVWRKLEEDLATLLPAGMPPRAAAMASSMGRVH